LKKWILAGLSVFVILPIGAYVALPQIASHTVEQWLIDQGFEDPEFTVEYPSNRSLTISTLKASKSSKDQKVTLVAGPITLEYKPTQLLLGQKFDKITLQTADLVIDKTSKNALAKEGEPFTFDLSLLLPDYWVQHVPAEQMMIGQVSTEVRTSETERLLVSGNLLFEREALTSRIHLVMEDNTELWGDLSLMANNRFTLNLLNDNQQVLSADGRAMIEGDRLHWVLNHETNLAKLHELLWKFPETMAHKVPGFTGAVKGRTKISAEQILTDDLKAWLDGVYFEDHSQINAVVLSPSQTIKVIQIDGEVDTQLTEEHGLKAKFDKNTQLALLNLKGDNWTTEKVTVVTQAPFAVTYYDTLSVTPFPMTVSSTPIKSGDIELKTRPIAIKLETLDMTKQRLTASFDSEQINIKYPSQRIPELSLKGLITLEENTFKSSFFAANPPLNLDISGDIEVQSDKDQVKLNWLLKELSLEDAPIRYRNYLPFRWPLDWKLTGGRYANNGMFTIWGGKIDGKINHSARNVKLHNDTLSFDKVKFKSTTYFRDQRIDDEGSLSVGQFDTGYVLDNINAEYRIDQIGSDTSILNVSALGFDFLGGKVEATPFMTTLSDLNLRTDVHLNELSLHDVLQLENQPGLKGDGKLSGTLPIQVTQGKISVNNGEIAAIGSGKIQYIADDNVQTMAASNQGLSIALKALSNFNYDTLSAKASYQPNGRLVLNTKLAGQNPDWNNGQAVNFSVNIEENLLQLMKSLRFSDQLEEQLNKKYNTQRTQ
jgi:hypothetical protein